MIGQSAVIEKIRTSNAKSILLTGPRHWGKKTLLRELFAKEDSVFEISGNAASFREAIERIYLTVRPTIYLVPDIDRCNQTVQNVLLKVLEEPPKSARFFLTAGGPVLPTIVSRCVTYRMEPYHWTNDELGGLRCIPQLMGMFESPGQLKLLSVNGIEDIILSLSEVKTVLENDGSTLASMLLKAKDFTRKCAEYDFSHEAFVLLAANMFGKSDSLDWLRQQPADGVKYVRTNFFMKYWLERRIKQ